MYLYALNEYRGIDIAGLHARNCSMARNDHTRGRKPGKKVEKSIYLHPEVATELEARAADAGLSFSAYVRRKLGFDENAEVLA